MTHRESKIELCRVQFSGSPVYLTMLTALKTGTHIFYGRTLLHTPVTSVI